MALHRREEQLAWLAGERNTQAGDAAVEPAQPVPDKRTDGGVDPRQRRREKGLRRQQKRLQSQAKARGRRRRH